MRVGILSQWYPPEPAWLPPALAAHLVERGHDVRVLTGFPNYPAGELYEGYRQSWRARDRVDGVDVVRTAVYPSHDASGGRRAATFLSFAASSSSAVGALADRDVVYVYATPMTAAAAAAVLRAVRGVPFVLHVQDLWPDSVVHSGMVGASAGLVGRVLDRAVGALYRRAAHVVAIAPTMRRLLVERGVPASGVSVVLNWSPDEPAALPAADPAFRGTPGRRLVLYAGNVGQVQDVETVVRAAALCRDLPLDVAVVGTGTALPTVRSLAGQLAAPVRFHDPVPAGRMDAVYAAADFSLVPLVDRPVFRATIPSKLQASLARGRPVITTAPGDVAAIVRDGGCGLAAPPSDPVALAGLLRTACGLDGAARDRMARAALATYRLTMSRASGVEALERVLLDTSRVARV